MAGIGNRNGEDEILTEALLDVLGLGSEAVQFQGTMNLGPTNHGVSAAHDKGPAPSVSAALQDAYNDSGISNIFYSDNAGDGEIHCRSCGAVCPSTNKYCGFCAAYLGNYRAKHQFNDVEVRAIDIDVALISINEDSSDGVRIPLKFNETILGRSGDSRFPSDAFLSPRHARLLVEGRGLFIEDLDSLNGTFLRTREEVLLVPGDCFLAGRELLRFERFEQVVSNKARSADGTRYMGSPSSGGDYKLVQIGVGNITQNVYCLSENGAVFGRETGDIVFNKHRFMSGRHAQIYPGEDGNFYLLDLNSSNGTWMKLNKKTQLYHGDLIFLGQQLFRVESPDID